MLPAPLLGQPLSATMKLRLMTASQAAKGWAALVPGVLPRPAVALRHVRHRPGPAATGLRPACRMQELWGQTS